MGDADGDLVGFVIDVGFAIGTFLATVSDLEVGSLAYNAAVATLIASNMPTNMAVHGIASLVHQQQGRGSLLF